MNIIHQDEHFFCIDKPEGFFVHPPEASAYPVPKEKICLFVLEKLLKKHVYPVHRLDAPTSGVTMFAYSKNATRELSRLFKNREIRKTYHAVARGYVEPEGQIDLPLEIKGFADPIDARTDYRLRARIELPFAVSALGKPAKYPTARYSLVEVSPHTGRWHQIRRHFDRIAHPLLGDIEHGDSHHNRFFRDHLKIQGLCLRAKSLEFSHPWTGESIRIDAPETEKWRRIEEVFYTALGFASEEIETAVTGN